MFEKRFSIQNVFHIVANIPIAAAVITCAVAQLKYTNARELVRLPITFGLLISKTTRTTSGGARMPFRTAE